MSMEGRNEIIVVALTFEEAHEVFSRCLRSTEEDNPVSDAVLKKLATALNEPAPMQRQAVG